MIRLALLGLMLALASCGGSSVAHVENPYLSRSHDFFEDGMAAMRRARWDAAERAFSRALLAAQLADAPELTRRAWYDLGMARRAAGRRKAAVEAFARARALARRHGDAAMAMRAWLALALAEKPAHASEDAALARALDAGHWPADVELLAARWRQAHRQAERARAHYLAARKKAGKDARGLRMKAQASLGLALLARDAGDAAQALAEADRALGFARQVGAPEIAAHALLLQGALMNDAARREDAWERALAIYQALGDRAGQRRALRGLLALSAGRDAARKRRLRLLLDALESPPPRVNLTTGEGSRP